MIWRFTENEKNLISEDLTQRHREHKGHGESERKYKKFKLLTLPSNKRDTHCFIASHIPPCLSEVSSIFLQFEFTVSLLFGKTRLSIMPTTVARATPASSK